MDFETKHNDNDRSNNAERLLDLFKLYQSASAAAHMVVEQFPNMSFDSLMQIANNSNEIPSREFLIFFEGKLRELCENN